MSVSIREFSIVHSSLQSAVKSNGKMSTAGDVSEIEPDGNELHHIFYIVLYTLCWFDHYLYEEHP